MGAGPAMTVAVVLNLQIPKLSASPLLSSSLPLNFPSSSQHLKFPLKPHLLLSTLHSSLDEDVVIGDCVVFEQGVFDEDPYQEDTVNFVNPKKSRFKKKHVEIEPEDLVPDEWKQVQAAINITKKERRKIAQESQFNSRVNKRRAAMQPIRSVHLEEIKAFREAKLAQLKPLVLDNPTSFQVKEEPVEIKVSERVQPRNPRLAVYGKGLDDVVDFFNSDKYVPGDKKSEGTPRKLFTKEEKVLLNMKIPDVAAATSGKWLPLHTLASSGDLYLVNEFMKHNVDVNASDRDGLTALHKAIICKKQAIANYLLRESSNPFVRDKDGATLMHYAVQTASSAAIKILLLYNVDINLADNDGWTPLHVAVQARRKDVLRLLLIKGADKTLRNKDGLTPFDLCLYLGRSTNTYELIKMLKQLPKSR